MSNRFLEEAKELRLAKLRKAIQDGVNSEEVKEFNPKEHLKILKSRKK